MESGKSGSQWLHDPDDPGEGNMFLTLQQELEGWRQQDGQWFEAGAQSSQLSVDSAVQ